MLEPKYIFYLNDTYFDTIYGLDYYNDKKVFFTSGAKQFFVMYQVLRNKGFVLTIEEKSSGNKTKISDENEFKDWVKENYAMYVNSLERF